MVLPMVSCSFGKAGGGRIGRPPKEDFAGFRRGIVSPLGSWLFITAAGSTRFESPIRRIPRCLHVDTSRAPSAPSPSSAHTALRAQSDSKIVLGQSAPFTGPAAQLGIQFNQGAKVYFDQVNARVLRGKRTIELVNMDDGYEPELHRQHAQDDQRRCLCPVRLHRHAHHVVCACRSRPRPRCRFSGLSPGHGAAPAIQRYAFHIRASYNDETGLIVRQLTSLGLKKIAVFYQNDAYGKAGLDGVTLALAA